MSNQEPVVVDDNLESEDVSDKDLEGLEPVEADGEEELKKKLESANQKLGKAIQTKKNWRERAVNPTTGKLYRDELTPPQTPAPLQSKVTTPPDENEETGKRLSKLETAEEKRQFGHAKGLNPVETDHVFAYAQGMGIKPDEALESPFVKSALEAMRRTAENSDAIPSPSSRSPKVEGKTFSEMDPKDKEKNFPAVVASLQKKR